MRKVTWPLMLEMSPCRVMTFVDGGLGPGYRTCSLMIGGTLRVVVEEDRLGVMEL
jgi:hypothetical protein